MCLVLSIADLGGHSSVCGVDETAGNKPSTNSREMAYAYAECDAHVEVIEFGGVIAMVCPCSFVRRVVFSQILMLRYEGILYIMQNV